MRKYQNGEIIPLIWDGSREYYMAKGHVSELDFQAALLNSEGDWAETVVKIEHCYAFYGVGHDFDGEPCQVMMCRDKPGRGRFMVTKGYTDYGWECELESLKRAQEAGDASNQ